MLVDLLYFFVKILKYWEKNIGKKQKKKEKKPNHENNKSSIATFNKNYLKYVKQ